MKEDYLWDKTGESDAEIRHLENALRVFKYQETASPALPLASVLPFKHKPSSRKRHLRFALAMAACLLFGIIALGAWFQILRNNIEANRQAAEASRPQQENLPPPAPKEDFKQAADDNRLAVNPSENPPAKKAGKSKPSVVRTIFRTGKPATARNDLTARRRIRPATTQPKVYLTAEERYAYDQLMLALSITSSKLKIVKDKVEGSDEKKAL